MSYAEPGWYPDPSGGAGQRWWDGSGWTGHIHPPLPPVAPPFHDPRPAAPWVVQPAPPAGRDLVGLARAGIGLWVAADVVVFGYALLDAHRIHRQFAAYLNAVTYAYDFGAPTPVLGQYYRFPAALYLVQLVGLAAVALIAVWQNRAAHQARGMGFPAEYSPRFGAWGWVIPVANFWVPYRALRDCLPPGHPDRGIALRAYIAWLVAPVVGLAAAVVAVAADRPAVTIGVGLVLAATLVLAAAGLVRVINSIERQHHAARSGPYRV